MQNLIGFRARRAAAVLVWGAVFALLVGGPLSAAAKPAAETPQVGTLEGGGSGADGSEVEVIKLQFGWPVGLRGTARSTKVQVRSDRPSPVTPPTVVYGFEVKKHAKGILVDAGVGRLEGGEANPSDPNAQFQAALGKAVASGIPDQIISSTGEWLSFDDFDALQKKIADALDAVFDAAELPDEARAQIDAGMKQVMTREILQSQAESDWNALAGAWLDAELELGEAYELTAEESIPFLGNAVVSMRTEFQIAERTKCAPTDAEVRCVRLSSRTVPDEESLRVVMAKFLDQMTEAMGKEAQGMAEFMKGVDLETRMELITEPETLIPHRLSMSQDVNITTAAGPDGETVEVKSSTTRTQEYVYEGR